MTIRATGLGMLAGEHWLFRRGRRSPPWLLALATVAVHLTFPRLPDLVLFPVAGYFAMAPFGGGLGDLWRTAGRRRWVGVSDTHLRAVNLLVVGGLAVCWAVLVLGLAAVATPMGVLPVGLIWQTVRGPDLLVVAVVALSVLR